MRDVYKTNDQPISNEVQDTRLTEPKVEITDQVDGSSVESKRTWVKFDEESNDKNNTTENPNNITNGRSAREAIPMNDTTKDTPTTSLVPNKLSPPPPSHRNVAKTAAQQRQRPPSSQPTTSRSISPTQNNSPDITPAVLTTESTHVNFNNTSGVPEKTSTASSNVTNSNKFGSKAVLPQATQKTDASKTTSSTMRTIELSTGIIREGFANGDIIVTLLPCNSKWPWVTPAIFRPELVPEELMAQGLTLTVEEYVNAMETLVNDYRFTMYNICYKRILVCWIVFAFIVLLTMLFSGLQGVALFSLGVGWLFLNAAAIFLCMWIKLRLSRGLEKCLARVNKQLMKHKILLVLDDRGKISCHKVNLCFLYFDSSQCVTFLNSFMEQCEQNGHNLQSGWESKLDLELNDIVIQGSNPMRLSRKQAIAQEIYLSYLQRWGKDFLRRRLDWTVQEAGVHETPRHLQSSICPCQYEEEIFRNKIKTQNQRIQCCGIKCIGWWI